MIILEGPDGSGKSTFAKKLQTELNFEAVVKWNRRPESADELADNLRVSRANTKLNVIQDRIPWVTEPIYDAAKNGESRAPTWLYYLTGCTLLRTTVIYCRPPDEIIEEHATGIKSPPDADPKYVSWIGENIGNIVQLYDAFMDQLKPALVYNWTKDDETAMIGEIEKIVKKKRLQAAIRANRPKASKEVRSIRMELLLQSNPKASPGDS